MSVKVIAVRGTAAAHGKNGWWENDSPLFQLLKGYDIVPFRPDPFFWSTDLDGVNLLTLFRSRIKDHDDWEAGGKALQYYAESAEPGGVNIISHSHGRQVVLYAAANGLKIKTWIDVSGPVREDTLEIAVRARSNIQHMIHIYSKCDWVQILGNLFDGKIGVTVRCPMTGANLVLPHRYGHSGLLYTPEGLRLWNVVGLVPALLLNRRDK